MAFVNRVEINGTINTNDTVLSNINKIAAASQSFVTWDPNQGTWTTVLNRPGSAVMTFDDSNIVGSINVSGSGLNDLYNSVKVTFPNKDQRGEADERILTIPNEDRFDGELDNQLNLSFDIITDPVQAELLASIELKQSRVDKIIEFATDYRAIGLKAGELIAVSNEYYFERSSATPKVFRVISIEEIDTEDGGILLSITAIEYDSTVYSTEGLTREERIIESGITPKSSNVCIIQKEKVATGNRVGDALQTDAGRAAITSAGIPIFETALNTWSTAEVLNAFGPGTGVGAVNQLDSQIAPYDLGGGVYDNAMLGAASYIGSTWVTNNTVKMMEVNYAGPQGIVNYTINGRSNTFAAGIPNKTILFYSNSPTGPWIKAEERYMEWSSYITTYQISDVNVAPVYWLFLSGNLVTYDLSETNNITVNIDSVSSVFPAADGSGAGITLKFFLN